MTFKGPKNKNWYGLIEGKLKPRNGGTWNHSAEATYRTALSLTLKERAPDAPHLSPLDEADDDDTDEEMTSSVSSEEQPRENDLVDI